MDIPSSKLSKEGSILKSKLDSLNLFGSRANLVDNIHQIKNDIADYVIAPSNISLSEESVLLNSLNVDSKNNEKSKPILGDTMVSTDNADLPIFADRKQKIIVLLLRKICGLIDPTLKSFAINFAKLLQEGILTDIEYCKSALYNTFNNTNHSNVSRYNSHTSNDDEIEWEVEWSRNFNSSRFTLDFSVQDVINSGGFGKVYKVRHRLDNEIYAVKQIPFSSNSGFNYSHRKLFREVRVLARLDNINICRYYNAWVEADWALDRSISVSEEKRKNETKKSKIQQLNLLEFPENDINVINHEIDACKEDSFKVNSPESIDDDVSESPFHYLFPHEKFEDEALNFLSPQLNEKSHSKNTPTKGIPMNKKPHNLKINIEKSFSEVGSPTSTQYSLSPPTEPYQFVTHGFFNKDNSHHEDLLGSHHEDLLDSHHVNQLILRTVNDYKLPMSLYIQTQYCEAGNVSTWLESPNRVIDPVINMQIFFQIVSGLAHVHSNNIIHRDLKPSNLFMTPFNQNPSTPISASVMVSDNPFENVFLSKSSKDRIGISFTPPPTSSLTKQPFCSSCGVSLPRTHPFLIKIGDFGLSKVLQDSVNPEISFLRRNNDQHDSNLSLEQIQNPNTGKLGTFSYSSPEQLAGRDYDNSTDIYSLGIILYELYHPYRTGMERAISLQDLRKGILDRNFLELYPREANLVSSMTAFDPKSRPTAIQLLSDPYVQSFHLVYANHSTLCHSCSVSSSASPALSTDGRFNHRSTDVPRKGLSHSPLSRESSNISSSADSTTSSSSDFVDLQNELTAKREQCVQQQVELSKQKALIESLHKKITSLESGTHSPHAPHSPVVVGFVPFKDPHKDRR